MNESYFRKLETAFNEASSLGTDEQREAYVTRLANDDAGLAGELRMLLSLRNESEELFAPKQRNDFSLLLTTIGDNKRSESKDELLDVLRHASESKTVEEGVLASVRGFALHELVATGPTGFVFRGKDAQLARDVGIKVLAPSIGRDPPRRQAFVDEARLASLVRHPNVVTIYHISSEPDSPLVFYVMEWIDGFTLQEVLDEQGAFPIEEALELLQQLAAGLDAIHAQGVIHRDLKPANIILDPTGTMLTIVDFGIAFESTEILSSAAPAGTPLYMSPEQLLNEQVTHHADLFSFAEIACLLVTGAHPYSEDSLENLADNVINGRPRLPDTDDGWPQALNATLDKALSYQAAARFDSARDFFQALATAVGDAPGTRVLMAKTADAAPSDNENHRAKRRWPMSWLGLAMSLSLVGLAISIALLMAGVFNSPRSQEPAANLAARKTSAGVWEGAEYYRNFLGMRFVSLPEHVQPIETWPPDSEHAELFRDLGWRNMRDKRLVCVNLITRRQYADVMGQAPRSVPVNSSPDAPVTGLSYQDAAAFCQKLTEQDPDGLKYVICSKNSWTMAVYGLAILSKQSDAERLTAKFRDLSRGENVEETPLGGLLLEDVFGPFWEWTSSPTYKPVTADGVVAYSKRPETPAVRVHEALGGGTSDIFLHAHDMNYGMNDFLVSSESLKFQLEEDGETCYLRPQTAQKNAWVTYRYQLVKPIRSARLLIPLHLFAETSSGGAQVRSRSANGPAIEDCQWINVLEEKGPYFSDSDPTRAIDISELARGALEVEVKYWVREDGETLYHAQLGRTSLRPHLPNVFCFEAETGARLESMRQRVCVPTTHSNALLGFRVEVEPASLLVQGKPR